jgi:hypothetical protein
VNDKLKVGTAIVATAVVVGGGGAIAAGRGGGNGSTSSPAAAPRVAFFHGDHGDGGPLKAAADYLGLTGDQLRTELEAGKTLAQVAQAHGKSVQGLKDAIVAGAKADLDAAVAAGRITPAQETDMLDRLRANVDTLVTQTRPVRPEDALMTAAAKYLGVTSDALHTQLESGKSLADVAAAQGKSVAGLKDALVAQFKTNLDAFVNQKGGEHGPGGPGFAGPRFGFRH